MAEANALPRLLQSIFVAVNLREYGAELHLEASYDHKLAHPIADRPFFKIQVVHRQIV